MSGLGGVVFWDGRPAPEPLAAALMAPIRHRGPNGVRWEVRGSVALGQARLALRRGEAGSSGPVWSPDGSAAIVADASLDNREEVARRLGEGWWSAESSDAALILAAHERWGEAAVAILDGDFAFAIWDAARRRVFAARDAFGLRPLVYHWSRTFLAVASEPKQLNRSGLVPVRPDDETVAEHLLLRFAAAERTFLEGISRLQAGHVLVADAGGAVQRRWWAPRADLGGVPCAPADIHARFRELLKEAVRKRVIVDVPVASHLSGGVDSASIVVLAGELAREGVLPCPALATVSQVYPGLDCDESGTIAAVVAGVPFANHRVNPLGESLLEGLEAEIGHLDSPFALLQRGAANAETRLLREIGARVLLSGLGGDELAEEWPYFYDLARDGHVLRLLADAWTFRDASSWGFAEILRDSLRASLPQAGRRPRTPPRPPGWISPEFGLAAEVLARPAPPPDVAFPSRLQQQVWDNLTNPLLVRTLDTLEAWAAAAGLTIRFPFLDRGLAEFVLAVPYQSRSPGSLRKCLLRKSMAGRLPDAVMFRRRKVVFDSYVRQVIAEHAEPLRARLFGAPGWLAERFVPEAAARALFSPSVPESPDTAPPFWRAATLELFLRNLVVL